MSGSRFLTLLLLTAAAVLGVRTVEAGTCGDYLQGSHSAHMTTPDADSGSKPFAPCHGPNCKQGKPDSTPMPPTVPVSPSSQRQFGMMEVTIEIADASNRTVLERSLGSYSLVLTSGIFHPPRSC